VVIRWTSQLGITAYVSAIIEQTSKSTSLPKQVGVKNFHPTAQFMTDR
jgi:hypothetical protein